MSSLYGVFTFGKVGVSSRVNSLWKEMAEWWKWEIQGVKAKLMHQCQIGNAVDN